MPIQWGPRPGNDGPLAVPAAELPLPHGWRRMLTPQGQEYFSNDVTCTTQWTRPVAEADIRPLGRPEPGPELRPPEIEVPETRTIDGFQGLGIKDNGPRKLHDKELIIGIDFGTTTSSCAILRRDVSIPALAKKQIPDSFNNWMNQRSLNNLPTEITYSQGNVKGWGSNAADASNTYPDSHLAKWFKLHLKDSSDQMTTEQTKAFMLSKRNFPLPIGKSAVDLVSDYLALLRKSIIDRLSSTRPGISGYHITYVLSVPAIWNQKEKVDMQTAALKAGFRQTRNGEKSASMHLVAEPEAVAFGVWSTPEFSKPKTGETFVVCDAGGGTCDLICYKVLRSEPRIDLGELVSSSGGLCGSAYLNMRFESFLREKFKAHADTILGSPKSSNARETRNLNQLMSRFENGYKERFPYRRHEQEEFICIIDTSGSEYALAQTGFEDGRVVFSAETMETKVFLPVAEQVGALVREQLAKALKVDGKPVGNVYLVGGFGTSEYLHGFLSAMIGKNSQPQVVYTQDAQQMISRGAVLSHLASCLSTASLAVVAKRFTHSYAHKYRSGEISKHGDLKSRTFGFKLSGERVVEGCLDYLVKKDTRYTEGEVFQNEEEFHFGLTAEEYRAWEWSRDEILYTSAADNPPVWHGQPGRPQLREFCTLTLTSARVDKKKHARLIPASGKLKAYCMVLADGDVISITEAIYAESSGIEAY